jgi:hypothetical protein
MGNPVVCSKGEGWFNVLTKEAVDGLLKKFMQQV